MSSHRSHAPLFIPEGPQTLRIPATRDLSVDKRKRGRFLRLVDWFVGRGKSRPAVIAEDVQ